MCVCVYMCVCVCVCVCVYGNEKKLRFWGFFKNVILGKEKVDDKSCGHKLTQ